MSMISERRGSDEAQPEKRLRLAEATKSDKGKDPTQPEKHLMPAESDKGQDPFQFGDRFAMEYPEEDIVVECLHPEDHKLPEKPEDYYEIFHEEAQLEIIKEEPHPAAHSLIHIADKNSQVAGDYSTQIIQEKPQVVGDFSTENAKKMLSYCMICDENTDHDTFNCPDKETGFVWYDGVYMPNVCDLCNKVGHVGQLCPVYNDPDLDYDPPPPGPEMF